MSSVNVKVFVIATHILKIICKIFTVPICINDKPVHPAFSLTSDFYFFEMQSSFITAQLNLCTQLSSDLLQLDD